MIRLLAWLALIIVAVWLYRKKNRATAAPPTDQPSQLGDAEKMLSCAQCGVYIPASEAIQKQGQYFCCEQHAH